MAVIVLQQVNDRTTTAKNHTGRKGSSRTLFFGLANGVHFKAFRSLSTPKGFSALAHEFFARFAQRFLHYHLDRELSHHIGGNGRFPDRRARDEFAADLEIHCREAAIIVKKYSADWFSKAKFADGIGEAEARKFARTCTTKLRKELLIRGVDHV